eukprot:314308-Rhodomonas_salina.2
MNLSSHRTVEVAPVAVKHGSSLFCYVMSCLDIAGAITRKASDLLSTTTMYENEGGGREEAEFCLLM